MQTVMLSEAAVATLRFCVKGWKRKVRERDLPAYRELVDAGIMEPNGVDFQFTKDGWSRREQILAEEEDRLERAGWILPTPAIFRKPPRNCGGGS